MKALYTFLGFFVLLPSWYYLMYELLLAAHVDRLVWFIFYMYMVVNFLIKTMLTIEEMQKQKAANKA